MVGVPQNERVLRCLLAIVIGAGLGALAGNIFDGRALYTTLLVICCVVVGPLIAVVVGGRALRGSAVLNASKIEAARREERIALARVLSIRETGTRINEQPICVIQLLVALDSGRRYRTSVRELVSVVDLPRMQPGAVLVVAQLAADRPEVVVIHDPDPVWRQRVETDERIRSAGATEVWEPPVQRGRDAYGWLRIPRLVFLALVVGAAAVTLVPAYSQIAWQLRGETMYTGDNAHQAVEAIAGERGSKFFHVYIYRSWISAEMPTSAGALTSDDVSYDHGRVSGKGATVIQPDPEEASAELFDVADVEWSVLPAVMDEAARRSGITKGKDPLVAVSRDVSSDGASDPQLVVMLRNDYYNAYVTFDAKGKLLTMRGGVPGSESYKTGQ